MRYCHQNFANAANIAIIRSESQHPFFQALNKVVQDNYIPTKVTFSGPCTIVWFPDETKIVVRCSENEQYSHENAIAQAIMNKLFGSRSQFTKFVDEQVRINEEIEEKKELSRRKKWNEIPF